MKNISQIIRKLEKLGYKVEYGNGSIAKIYPSDENKPFYSLHIGERALHPLRRFAKKNWDLDLKKL
jgi:hypothetical protein